MEAFLDLRLRLTRGSLVVEFVAFSYIGVEVVGVTAYEARNLKDLRRPSKTIGYIVLLMYILHTFSEIMVVAWNDPSLGVISDDVGQTTPVIGHQTFPILDIAAQRANDTTLAHTFTGLLIYSSWSASNISLYIACKDPSILNTARHTDIFYSPNLVWAYAWLELQRPSVFVDAQRIWHWGTGKVNGIPSAISIR